MASYKCLNMYTCYYCSYSSDEYNRVKLLRGYTKTNGSLAATKLGGKLLSGVLVLIAPGENEVVWLTGYFTVIKPLC